MDKKEKKRRGLYKPGGGREISEEVMKKAIEQEFITHHVTWKGDGLVLCGTLTDCPGSPASPGLPWKPCGP